MLTDFTASDTDTIGIKRYSMTGIETLLKSWGEPAFRAKQLLEWIYKRNATSYDEMSNLSAALRERLKSTEPLSKPTLVKQQQSSDGTRKYLFKLADGHHIEAVGIPSTQGAADRLTVCFSTQVGCAMACSFCATGKTGLTRSLFAGEMVDQLQYIAEDFNVRASNAVAMGEGEPFANYDNTIEALRIMNSPLGLSIGARHLTVSTCGLLNGIAKFSTESEQFTLAVSLHSAVQSTRDILMPKLANTKIADLWQAIKDYGERTKRRPSLEITLISGVNDSDAEIAALKSFCRGLMCHVNLIVLNPTQGTNQQKPGSEARANEVLAELVRSNIECSLRNRRGADIDAACGQLKGR